MSSHSRMDRSHRTFENVRNLMLPLQWNKDSNADSFSLPGGGLAALWMLCLTPPATMQVDSIILIVLTKKLSREGMTSSG